MTIGLRFPGLSGRCEEIARTQAAAGRLALGEADRSRFAETYEAAVRAGAGTENELLRLLTRPFSRLEPIPMYYRYSSLHVYDWFLRRTPGDDPVAAAVVALDATLAELAAVERQEAAVRGADAPHLPERLRRLAVLRTRCRALPVAPHGKRLGGDAIDEAAGDPGARWRAAVLTSCTGFPMSDHHDEHIFLRAVHACELAFYVIRRLAVDTVTRLAESARSEALALLGQLAHHAEVPNHVFHVLRTLTPELFMGFREATGAASAVQSLNYHLMELVVYGHDPRKAAVFDRFEHLRELNAPRLRAVRSLREAVGAAGDGELAGALAVVERGLLTWRGRHYGFGRRYLPGIKGSGGTEGADYLKPFVDKVYPPAVPATVRPPVELTRFAFR
ncbi:tryptophan 2,3-dioxygenase family protein [Streptomyces sp. URMC 127]|uniref:tryptophan 2,3-dioxygenase family protein n=1 Tax=Streptomyces sp. URMC 127 TaxID=3423402 RepID=UPI003F1C9D48